MGQIEDGFATTFRPFVTDGVPASGANKPSKAEAAALGKTIETVIGGIAAGLKPYATKALLDADTTQPLGTLAHVYDDATPANNGVYHYETGGWVFDTAYYEGVAAVVQPLVDEAIAAADRASEVVILPSRYINGAFDIDGPTPVWVFGSNPPVAALTDPFMVGYDIDRATVLDPGVDSYRKIDLPALGLPPVLPGQWIAFAMVAVGLGDAPTFPSGDPNVQIYAFENAGLSGGQIQKTGAAFTNELVNAGKAQVYSIVFQNTLSVPVNAIVATLRNNTGAQIRGTAYVLDYATKKPGGVDWTAPDPFGAAKASREIAALQSGSGIVSYAALGHSIVAGTGASNPATTSWVARVGYYIGSVIENENIGGQTSQQILNRYLGFPVRVSGNQLLTGENSVTLIDGSAPGPKPDFPTRPLNLPLTGADAITRDLHGRVGSVSATLRRTAIGGFPPTNEVYKIIPDAGSALPAKVRINTPFIVDRDEATRLLVEFARNDFGYPDANQLQQHVMRLVTARGLDGLLLVGDYNGYGSSQEAEGTAIYAEIVAYNNWLSSTYPRNSLDIRRMLIDRTFAVLGITPDANNQADINADVVPRYILADGLHPNDTGHDLIAQFVVEWMVLNGWVTLSSLANVPSVLAA